MGDAALVKQEPGSQAAFQTKELGQLLDVVDDLRLQGITAFIDLPQLIVCGDQSSGKSSVLEALSGVSFPTKDNLCTRYPTELILRRKPDSNTTITIVPDANRSDEEKQKLQNFKVGKEALDDFGATVENAGRLMGLEDNARAFCTDVLRVELTGPTMPHLTLVDLPGLFHSGNKSQSDSDAQIVKDLVTGYMKRQRSIILAVVSAKNDYANQVVTKHARDVDPDGTRTLGIITKPDLLDEGSCSEQQYLEMAENKDVVLRLGWHVLKNRDFKQRESTIEERNKAEADFFARGIWKSLSPSQLGIASLKSRLSRVLRDHILTELPNLTKDVEAGIKDCEQRLDRLGVSRATIQDQRRYLLQISQVFCKIIDDGITGYYNSDYFEDISDNSYPKRIRAVVMNLLDKFASDMRINGKRFVIVTDASDEDIEDSEASDLSETKGTIMITRTARLKQVADLIEKNRGRELPGFAKFETVITLFRELCQPWQEMVRSYCEMIFESVQTAIYLALESTSDRATCEGLIRFIINPALSNIRTKLNSSVERNLQQHIKGHPMTLNHYFTENLQKLRNEHQAEFIIPKLRKYFGTDHDTVTLYKNTSVDLKEIAKRLTTKTEADMNEFTCSEALHYVDAYYKVALKFFIDDFSIHTVEQGLFEKLTGIFNQDKVLELQDEEIENIAAESDESKVERVSSSAKLTALREALRLLRQLNRGRLAATSVAK